MYMYSLSHDNRVIAGAPSAPDNVRLFDDSLCSWNKSENMPVDVPLNYTVIVESEALHKEVCSHLTVELHMTYRIATNVRGV